MIITARQLRRLGACAPDLARYRREWGDGPLEVTRNRVHRAVSLDLDLVWAAEALLSSVAGQRFLEAEAAAWEHYVFVAARDCYLEATDEAAAERDDEVAEAFWDAVQHDDWNDA